jgi:hypothetical protein
MNPDEPVMAMRMDTSIDDVNPGRARKERQDERKDEKTPKGCSTPRRNWADW